MSWPQATEYSAVIQSPEACFSDPALKQGRPERDARLGLPRSRTGSASLVYKIMGPGGGAWAVKFFTHPAPERSLRYQRISRHLAATRQRFLVEPTYLPEGARVGGDWYPIVKMAWVEGPTLDEFVRDHAGDAAVLGQLAGQWVSLAAGMDEVRVAHGDLQHGNVLVAPGRSGGDVTLRLIDYDGMWVPDLAAHPPGELGHPNYQHPQRVAEGHYGPEMDRFSHLVIYTALRGVAAGGRALWERFDTGERLLFGEADFRAPERSPLLAALRELGDAGVTSLVTCLARASQGPLRDVPLLSELLSSGEVAPLTPPAARRTSLASTSGATGPVGGPPGGEAPPATGGLPEGALAELAQACAAPHLVECLLDRVGMPIARRAPPHLPPQRQLEEACRLIEAGATGGGLAGLLAAAAALFPQNAAFDRWSPDRPPGGARPPAYPPRGSPPGPPGRSRGSGRGDRDLEEDGRDRPAGKLLFLAASPTDMPHLRYGKEWEAIRCVASSPSAVGVEVVPRFAVSPEGLLDAVTREKPSFLHFCGHGEASGHIVLEGPEGGPLYLSVERLAEIIRAANTVGRIRLVCLNACYVAGVADVLCQDVEVVVGSTTAIFDELAIIFARRFYFSLLEGYPLVAAVTLGRQSMELHLEESPALAERWRTVVARQKTTITNEVIIRHHQDVDPRTWALQRR